jgi:hypothetical protein
MRQCEGCLDDFFDAELTQYGEYDSNLPHRIPGYLCDRCYPKCNAVGCVGFIWDIYPREFCQQCAMEEIEQEYFKLVARAKIGEEI